MFDIADREFMPSFFHLVMGEYLDMSRHESCAAIRVVKAISGGTVVCVSANGREVLVGKLGQVVYKQGFYQAYQVIWNSNAEILQSKNPKNGALSYSVVVKN